EVRNPFLDRRLVELCLRLPPEAIYRDGTTKVVMREALHDVLPPLIRDRRDKGDLTPLQRFGLQEGRRAFLELLLEDSELERRGYVLPAPWQRDIRACLRGDRPCLADHWLSLTAEMWLRKQVGRLPPLD